MADQKDISHLHIGDELTSLLLGEGSRSSRDPLRETIERLLTLEEINKEDRVQLRILAANPRVERERLIGSTLELLDRIVRDLEQQAIGLETESANPEVETDSEETPSEQIEKSRHALQKAQAGMYQTESVSPEVETEPEEIPAKIDDDATWMFADWLSLGEEAKRRSISLDNTVAYVLGVCKSID